MNNASKSIFVFGLYVTGVGLIFLLIPNTLLHLFGWPETSEIWVHVLGAMAAILGLYYLQAARQNQVAFFRMTVWGRVLFMLSLIALGLLTSGNKPLILFGLIDLSGVIWSWTALRQEAK